MTICRGEEDLWIISVIPAQTGAAAHPLSCRRPKTEQTEGATKVNVTMKISLNVFGCVSPQNLVLSTCTPLEKIGKHWVKKSPFFF